MGVNFYLVARLARQVRNNTNTTRIFFVGWIVEAHFGAEDSDRLRFQRGEFSTGHGFRGHYLNKKEA